MSAGPQTALFTGSQPPIDPLASCGSFCHLRTIADPAVQVLPAAPSGFIWYVMNGSVQIQAAGATTWSIREEVPSEPVRPMDVRSTAFVGTAGQPGGIATQGPLVFQVTAGQPTTFSGTAFLLPSSSFQRYYLALTNAFQVVPISLFAGSVVRPPFFWGPVTPAAFNNGDTSARTFELRFTRGATVIVNTNSGTPAGSRVTPIAFANLFPPLQVGDVLEARVTTVPAAGSCFLNGLLERSRELTL